MSIITAQDVIRAALLKLGVLAEGETATAPQMNDGLDTLNMMLDSWSGRSLLTTAQIQESFPLTANQSAYTIGVGGNFNTTKPFSIADCFVRDAQNLDYDMSVIPRDVYDAYSDKALLLVASRPESLFYDPGVTQQANQTGTIHLYPTPDASTSYTLFIDTEKSFTEFVTLTSAVTFPPAYKRAIVYNLCVELGPDYGRTISQEVHDGAFESMRIIETINSNNKKGVASFDFPGRAKGYNIYSDQS